MNWGAGGCFNNIPGDFDPEEANSFDALPYGILEFETAQGPNAVVPEPMTVVLLGTGLFGLAVVARRRQRDEEVIPD